MGWLDKFRRLPDEGRSAREIYVRNTGNADRIVREQFRQATQAAKTTKKPKQGKK
jgi:hypothetical protein